MQLKPNPTKSVTGNYENMPATFHNFSPNSTFDYYLRKTYLKTVTQLGISQLLINARLLSLPTAANQLPY